MEFLTALWLPILLSGIALFFASFVAWTILPTHKNDWGKAPDEPALLEALRSVNLPVGRYAFPYGNDKKSRESGDFQKAWEKGPRGTLNVWSMPSMGANMGFSVLLFLAINTVVAYLAWFAFDGKAPGFIDVFRFVGTASLLTYSFGPILDSIWFRRPILGGFFDGIAYSLIAGALFGWLWPS